MKRFFKIIGFLLLFLCLLIGGLTLSLRIPAVQNYLAHVAVDYLSKKLGTKVAIKSFQWDLFKDIDLKGFYMEDKKGDTLVSAGSLTAEISYWSLFKKEVKIKSISLVDAKVRLQNDTAGRMNLMALFAPTADSVAGKIKPAQDSAAHPFSILIDIRQINLTNTDFRFEDQKKHLMVSVVVPKFNVAINKLALQNKLIDLGSLDIDGVKSSVTVENKDLAGPQTAMSPFKFLPPGWVIKWDQVNLTNATFAYNDANKPQKSGGMDFAHLSFEEVMLKGKKGSLHRDSVDAEVKLLSAQERSGFEIKKLSGLVNVSVDGVTLRNMNLQTGNSSLNAYVGLTYSDFEDFNNFSDSVTIKADLHDASISLKDIGYFAKNMGQLAHNTIRISGKLRGKLNDLQGKNISLSTAYGTYLKCNFYTHGLPDINEASLNLRIDEFATSAQDIRSIYPSSVYPPNFNTLGRISFSGDFDGFLSDFVTRGNLYTDIGSASSDLNFKYDKRLAKSAYSGDLSLKDFDLGKWFGNQQTLGKVSLHTSVEGSGVKLETLNAKLLGDVSSITLLGYDYKDLKVDGLVKGKFFSGNLVVKDQYLDADFTGTVDMTDTLPRYNFASSIRTAHLRDLHITKDTFNLSGDVTADFSGKKADNLVGAIIFNNVNMQHGHESVLLKNLSLTSNILPDNSKEIKILSDNVDGEIKGKFSFTGLPKALKNYVNYTFTKNYQDPGQITPEQFKFELRVFDSSGVSRVIDPRFKEIRNTVVSGEFNSTNHTLNLSGTIPELVFDKYTFSNFSLDAGSQSGVIDVAAKLDKVYVDDSLMADGLSVHSYSEDKEFRVDVRGSDSKHFNRADISAYIKPQPSSAEIRFLPSEVWLGGNKWSFAPNNHILIHGRQITTDSLIFASGIQSIRLDSYLKNDTSTSVNVQMNETSLGDFVNIFTSKVRDLKGTVNGSLKVEDIFSNPAPTGNVELKDFYLGTIPIGTIKVNSTLDNAEKKINIDASLIGDKSNLAIHGFYDLAHDQVNLDNDIRSLDLNFLNYPLFAKYVRHVTGTAQAKLNLHGKIKALDLTGLLRINQAKVNVSYLNTTYSLKDEDIEIGNGYFDIGTVDVIDSFNNKAYGTGRIYHQNFRKVTLDLHVVTEKMQVLNTTVKDLPVFYGNGMVKGSVDFSGTIPAVTIDANATVRTGTRCAIPINNNYETNKYNFYRFVNVKKDTVKLKKEDVKLKGVNFHLNLDINPDGVLDIILDPNTGDILSSRGSGTIHLDILRTGEFVIRGGYTIDQGNYLFTMQNIVNKKFELEQGGTIIFNGDVNNAQLNADAIYHVKTSTYDLISDLLQQNNIGPTQDAYVRSQNRINVDLMLKLKGVLQSPEISFDVRPVDPDPAVRTYVENKMQLIRTTESEMNKQVFGLLVMNRFLPSGNSSADAITSGRNIGNSATNTVSEFLSSQLSLYMGSFFENLNVRDLDINLNFKTYDQTSLLTQSLPADNLNARREVQLALTKKFFNNRLSVNVGGNLDFGDNYQTVTTGGVTGVSNNKSTYATGDFQVEYVLDKKGAWRAKTYNRNDYDNFNNRNINKTGIGLSFRQEFDNWADLFRRKGKKPKKQNLPKPAAKQEDTPKPADK